MRIMFFSLILLLSTSLSGGNGSTVGAVDEPSLSPEPSKFIEFLEKAIHQFGQFEVNGIEVQARDLAKRLVFLVLRVQLADQHPNSGIFDHYEEMTWNQECLCYLTPEP